jgi:hypothetical protein
MIYTILTTLPNIGIFYEGGLEPLSTNLIITFAWFHTYFLKHPMQWRFQKKSTITSSNLDHLSLKHIQTQKQSD